MEGSRITWCRSPWTNSRRMACWFIFSLSFFWSLNFFERFLILFLSGCTFLRRDRMLDAENHVAQQTSLRTHRLMDQCDVVPKVGKALHWRIAASMSSTIWITREGQQDLFSAILDCWKSHLSHGTGSLWPSSALLPLCRAIHLREQELQLFPMLDLAPSIQPWENELWRVCGLCLMGSRPLLMSKRADTRTQCFDGLIYSKKCLGLDERH